MQQGVLVLLPDVSVADGLFTICPHFGVEVFDGSAHWLQTKVRPTGGGGVFTPLPRQEIKAAPYALQTRGIFVNLAKDVGIGTINPIAKLHVRDESDHAIFGEALSTSAQHYGVLGQSSNSIGRGVYGYAIGASGMNYGVYGRTDSNNDGRGVYGLHWNPIGTGPGVLGQSNSQSANASGVHGLISSTVPGGFSAGVRGENRGTAGSGIGVFGSHDGAGWGVYGVAEGTGGFGVFGRNDSTNARGVYGLADQIDSYGVHGRSSLGVGAYGLHSSATGLLPGVLGETNSTLDGAIGVLGRAAGATGETIGVYGESVSSDGIGVMGAGMFGVAIGGKFTSNSLSGYGIYAENTAGASTARAIYARGVSAFRIAGGEPHMSVSWTVTGVRNDEWVRTHGAPVVTENETSRVAAMPRD